MSDLDHIRARGDRFRLWYEQDGLRDAFEGLKALYAARVTQLDPHAADFAEKAKTLALARKAVEQVEAAVVTVMAEGSVAANEVEHIKKLEAINPRKRRFL